MSTEHHTEPATSSAVAHRFIEANGIRMYTFAGAPECESTTGSAITACPHLRELVFPGCGHWIQQERATQVNEAIITFLQNL